MLYCTELLWLLDRLSKWMLGLLDKKPKQREPPLSATTPVDKNLSHCDRKIHARMITISVMATVDLLKS